MEHCNQKCKFLNTETEQCELTGEDLERLEWIGVTERYCIYQHKGRCMMDENYRRE